MQFALFDKVLALMQLSRCWFWSLLLFCRHVLSRLGVMTVVTSGLYLDSTFTGVAQTNLAGSNEAMAVAQATDENITNGLGSWIWASKTFDRQWCQFWRSFQIPPQSQVVHARLAMTVDNECTLFLDGRELGRGDEWHELFEYDLTPLLSAGIHVLAVKAYNSSSFAGMIFGLRIDLADGKTIEVKSDESWSIVPSGTKGWERMTKPLATWPRAAIIAPLGATPWWTTPVKVNLMPTLQPVKVFFWQTGWFQITLFSLSVLVILISLRLVAQLAMHRKDQWLLQQERARIARDIHDDLGSRMTKLVLHGEVVQSDLPPDSETRFQVEKICEEARGILSTMDEILWAVNPKRDAFRDFLSYICGYAQEFLQPTGIQCLFDIDPAISDVALNLPLKRTLLILIKEALNNTVKHSKATELVLTIKWQAQQLDVIVKDNGKGFDQAALDPTRNGLVNMAHRANELGGTFLITSQPGKGCRTEFSIPLKRSSLGSWSWLGRSNRMAFQHDETKRV
jgi:signal transduction histidine kinase